MENSETNKTETNLFNRLNHPFSICFDDDQTMYITDFDNHRIQKNDIDFNLTLASTTKSFFF